MNHYPRKAHLITGLSIILLLFGVFHSHAQEFFPIREKGLWGAINLQGETTISPSYDFIGDFSKNNVAIAAKNNLNGLIDGQGKILMPLAYKKIRRIGDNQFSVCNESGCALADQKGKILTDFGYQALIHFGNALFKTYKDKKFGLVTKSGDEIAVVKYSDIRPYPERQGLILLELASQKGLIDEKGHVLLEPKYDEILFENAQLHARANKAFTVVWLDEENSVLEKKDFPNEMAKNLELQARLRKEKLDILKNNPEARKPRWTYEAFRYTLENGVGKNLLGDKEFFDVGIDENLKKSLAREVIPPKQKGEEEKIICYLIDHENAKILYTAEVRDMVISDFNVSDYARATVDTLWDALIDKEGNLVQEIEEKTISNIGNFNNGLAWIKSGSTYGFINLKAQLAIPFNFQIVSDFENGYAVARKEGLFGCINTKGSAVIPFVYDGIDLPTNGICRVKKGKGRQGRWGAVNLQNKTIIPFEYSLIYPFKDGVARMRQGRNWGLISNQGKTIIPPSISCDFLGDFEKGIAMVGMERWVEETPTGPVVRYKKQGYIKKDGTYLLEPMYDKIEGFEEIWQKEEGIARIYKNGKVGYVNYKGIIELEAVYDETYRFDTVWRNNTGISPVKKDGKYGYLDHNGNEIIPCIYQEISANFIQVGEDSLGVAKVEKDGKYGFVNYQGKEVVPTQYEAAATAQNGIIPVKMNGLWGAIDTLNNKILDLRFDGTRFLDGNNNKLLELLKQEDAYFEVDSNGKFLREVEEMPREKVPANFNKSPKYEYKSDFDENGLAVVERKGKLALINSSGDLLTKYKYKEIEPFSEGLALVRVDAKDRKDQLYGYINQQGEEVIVPQFKLAKSFGGGHAAILDRANWGFINKEGKMVINPKFKEPGEFSGGYAIINGNRIYDKNGNLTGEFLLAGEITDGFQNERAIVQSVSGAYHITPKGLPAYYAKYDEITPFVGKIAFVKRGEMWELTRKTGEYTKKLRFSRANKNSYLAAYGERRKERLKDGTMLEDLNWELVANGTWKMIDADGNFLSDIVLKNVAINKEGIFTVNVENKLGLANLKGEIVAEREYEVIRMVSDEVIRLESAGKIGYLSVSGKWLKKVE